MSLFNRSIQSSLYNTISHGVQVLILFLRSVILARLLTPEIFGVYAFVQAIVTTTITLPSFGLGSAYIHRSPETESPDAEGVYFTLIAIFSLAWAVLLIATSSFLLDRDKFLILSVLVVTSYLQQLAAPAQSILAKQVQFQRLAILGIIQAVLSTIVAVLLARYWGNVWSLLSVNITQAVILIIGLYVIKPVWRPRLAWSLPIVRYFIEFGGTTLFAVLLTRVLDRLDDIWTGYFLGDRALGFYSRAYTFANYPRRILASPISTVALSTYAEVKQDRPRLSRAFFRVNALIIRVGFLFSGALFLISPVFVRLVLGEKWLPAITVFRFMLAYTLLDPIKATVGHLFISIGRPNLLVRIRLIQLIALVIGLVTLGSLYGITGVAISATIMVVTGISILLWNAREHIDFSLLRLFGVPIVALVIGVVTGYISTFMLEDSSSDLLVGIVRFVVFALIYSTVVLLVERHQVCEMFRPILRLLNLGKN